ncbi:glycosyltransferase family 39 protein [Pseudonocardia endophytica]|uniref:Dolichyl-phosphate-mannose-protein mannosyltransferase n=1 Tax=Pseudonocardia endophytica TaxID=401976 RepID=A0A4R1HHJ1_PSEEN|nr:glycosyltransferase family 39 protein [Pseudonocardia endophytica]TCK21704.1 dolichyl-phosphate-mannose-protein mannosyltransferase [Pseudonocardia endophytica]
MTTTAAPAAAPVSRLGRWGLPALTAVVLLLASGGYGYHRDELYFLAAGRHLAWGYVDQGLLTPLFARIATELFGDSLVGLRVIPALLAGAVVLVTATIARDLGGGRAEQAFAAVCTAVSAILLQTGHLLSTTTTDLLAWTLVTWLAVRALRGGGGARWIPVGLAAGVGLLNKPLTAFLLGALVVALLVAGPRWPLRDRWFWVAGAVAVVLWLPFLLWQAANGAPLLTLADSIAGGGSTSSEPWWLVVPFQAVLVSPLLIPVWVAGVVALARDRTLRAFPIAFVLLAVVFTVTGGKPYYLCGLYPVLLAAGAGPVLRWASSRVRATLLGLAVALSAVVNVMLMLPVVPEDELARTPITAMVADVGETVGWPAFATTVGDVARAQPPGTVVLTGNYGEAGALQRFAPDLDVYSGQNAYAYWGVPPARATTVVAVGYERPVLQRWFGDVVPAARIDNGVGLDNQEQGRTVWVCRGPLRPWGGLWPEIRHVG